MTICSVCIFAVCSFRVISLRVATCHVRSSHPVNRGYETPEFSVDGLLAFVWFVPYASKKGTIPNTIPSHRFFSRGYLRDFIRGLELLIHHPPSTLKSRYNIHAAIAFAYFLDIFDRAAIVQVQQNFDQPPTPYFQTSSRPQAASNGRRFLP